MKKLVYFIFGVLLADSYTEPDCHDLILFQQNEAFVAELAFSIDKCFWKRFEISDPFDASWFRCTTRRPSGVTGFTPNSLKAVLSRAQDNARHITLARTILAKVCEGEEDFVPYELLRFHIANVLKVNMLMVGNMTPNPYKHAYDNILSDASDGQDDTLWHLMNIVGSFYLRNRRSVLQTWMSAALDAWLIGKIEPKTSTAMFETFQTYWHCILQNFDSPYTLDIDEDVGQPLLELIGAIYASSLKFDVDVLLKKLAGVRGRITRLNELISQN